MHDTSWVIVDTETTGVFSPIYAVEIAAQRMRGWKREGDPFRVLLNHDVPIEPQAQSVHGYSREFLRQHGLDPREAHRQFRDYVGTLPIVAHNLTYDWDRVLLPEYQRLGIPVTGQRGFCSMTLARRVVAELRGHGLGRLTAHFFRGRIVEHNALPDTLLVAELFETVYGPRLIRAGVATFPEVARFSRRTPVNECVRMILSAAGAPPRHSTADFTDGADPFDRLRAGKAAKRG